MSTSLNEQDFIQLNAYLDGELPAREREAFEARLVSDVGLQRELDALRVTVSLVGMAERVPVPRNFTLDPAIYGKPARQGGLLSLWPALSTAGAALSTVLLCVGLLLFVMGRGGGFMMAPSAAGEVAADEAAQLEAPAPQVFEEPVEEAAEAEAVEEEMEEAPMAMEAAPAEEQEAPAEEEMAVEEEMAEEEAAPAFEAEEQAVPTPNPTGVGGGMPAEEEPPAEAEEPATDMVEGEAAVPSPTLAPLPTVEMDDGADADRAASDETNEAEMAEILPQPESADQEGLGSDVAAVETVPARSKFRVAPLPVILLAVGGLGLAASLFGLVSSLRRRR